MGLGPKCYQIGNKTWYIPKVRLKSEKFEDFGTQRWNTPTDRAQRVNERNGFICLVIMFTPRVMVIKMLKKGSFLYILLTTAKKSQFGYKS